MEARKGPKVDLTRSRVPDPASIPADKSSESLPQTMWRIDRLREMTYTQFWQLIQEQQIERVCSYQLRTQCSGCIHCTLWHDLQPYKTGMLAVCSWLLAPEGAACNLAFGEAACNLAFRGSACALSDVQLLCAQSRICCDRAAAARFAYL